MGDPITLRTIPILQPPRTITSERKMIADAFDALLAQHRAEILFWACSWLRVDGVSFAGSFNDLRQLHAHNPGKIDRVTKYLEIERQISALRMRLCP